MEIQLHDSWKSALSDEFSKDYMKTLKSFLVDQIKSGKTVYPHGSEIFNALNLTPLDQTKVVIFGQDPYHGPGQAHGLCFSVKRGIRPPPSLKNIYKELADDIGFAAPEHGCLEAWAKQGVLMLNAVLTVERHKAGSHRNQGWESFTDRIVKELNENHEGLVFLLWGRDAKRKGENIDRAKHLVLESAHPSPFSATGFFGNKHFSKANKFLEAQGKDPVDWTLPLH